jgi:hypothetical protein
MPDEATERHGAADERGVVSGAKPDVMCEKHRTSMIREREHVGNGKWEWGEPYCPLCRELEAKEAKAKVAGDRV